MIFSYTFSRFFRNVAEYLRYKNILKDAGVRLVSATQDLPEGPSRRAHGAHPSRL